VILKNRPNRISKNKNVIIAWADVLSRSCGGTQADVRVHLCAKNPCVANWEGTKYGSMSKPIHLQPTERRPLAGHASPAPAVAVEMDSVVKEGDAGGGADGNEHVDAGGQEEGAHAGAGELAVAAPSGQASAASGADELMPEETAASVGISSGSIERLDEAHESEEAAAGGAGEDMDEGAEVSAEDEDEHGGAGVDGEPCVAMRLAAVAVPLSPLRLAPQGAPLKPRIILAPLALALDAPVILHDASLDVLPARQDDATAALQAGVVFDNC